MTKRRRLSTVVAATIAAAIVIGALAGILAARSDDDPGSVQRESGKSARDKPAKAPVKGAALKPLVRGRPGSGTARLRGRGRDTRLELSVSGLPPLEEQYTVWLYNSITDARRVAAVIAGSFTVSKRLRADPAGYELIDISREPLDDNPNHSGESVLRVPVDALLGASG